MARYNSWEEAVKSKDEIFEAYPRNLHIEKGTLHFTVKMDGIEYICSGSHCYVSDIYFDPSLPLKDQCDFDNFWMYERDNPKNEVCNW